MNRDPFWKDPMEGEKAVVYWTGTKEPLCGESLWEGNIVRLPVPPGDPWISIVLGGGFILPATDGSGTDTINPVGILHDFYSRDAEGAPFPEKVTACLAGERRVFIGYPHRTSHLYVDSEDDLAFDMVANDWLEMMDAAGFNVRVAVGDGPKDYPYVSAIGTGTQLARTHWLKGQCEGDPLVLFASDGVRTPLEELIAKWTPSGSKALRDELTQQMYRDHRPIWQLIAGADLFFSCCGFEGGYEAILNVRGVPVERIHEVLKEVAESLGLHLYYGGEAPQARESTRWSYVFDDHYRRMPIPSHWEQIV
ncbi:MAG TPA: hypothetical protein VGM51_00755 [Armatimonadota bacterium]|jgi:hypothetical protein